MATRQLLFACAVTALLTPTAAAAARLPAPDYRGRILLQADAHGEAWWVDPTTGQRTYMRDGRAWLQLAARKGLGINDADLARLAIAGQTRRGDTRLTQRLKGRLLLAVQSHGAAYYVNPRDAIAYPLGDVTTASRRLGQLAVGVATRALAKLPMAPDQIAFDPIFNGVASARLDGAELTGGSQADVVLPLASLTKLVTALVVLDAPPDWSRTVTVTADDLAYPQRYVNTGDVTSEIPLQADDRVTLRDLWAAMLIASSNQAAAVLARETGLTPAAFTTAMNAKAASLGLQRTAFTEPSGLDVGNLGTAREMAAIARAAFAIPLVREITLQRGVAIVASRPDGTTRTVDVVNRNVSVLALGVDAAKTGFLIEAQRNLAVRKGDRIAVVLHARSMSERNGTIQELLE